MGEDRGGVKINPLALVGRDFITKVQTENIVYKDSMNHYK